MDCSACNCDFACFFSTIFNYVSQYGLGKDQSPNSLIDVKNGTCTLNSDKITLTGLNALSTQRNMYEML